MSRRLALLIGNVHYQDGRLHAPVSGKMFTSLADALESPAAGFDEVFVSLNKPAVELQLAIAEFLELSQTPDDVLLLYFAGHALYHQGRPYLACSDTFTASYLDATTIQADYVRRRVSLHPSGHKLIILDCSTSALLASDGLPADDAWLGQAFQVAGVQVVAAARPYFPDSPSAATLTPALINALHTGEARLDGVGLATAVALLRPIATPLPPVDVAVVAPVADEASADEASADELSVDEMPTNAESAAAEAETPIITEETGTAEPSELAVPEEELVVLADSEAGAAAVPMMAEPTAVPEESARKFSWRYGAVALIILLLLLAAAGLYNRDGGWPTAVSPNPTPTTAVVMLLPATEPTPSPTKTTRPTASATASQTPAVTNTAVPPTASPSPTPSPTVAVTLSPTAVDVHTVRQLVFMRSGPAINFRIIEYLVEGTAVTVLGRTESGEWYNVQLDDGRTGWLHSEMVDSPGDTAPPEIPIVGTIPAPANEFHDFVAQFTEEGLTVTVGHVYVGTGGPEGIFQATLLPETDLIQATYDNGQELGLGAFVVRFAPVGEGGNLGEYTSTAVQLCMVSPAGEEFYCETFPVRRVWGE